jgi:hypothetical protein
VQSISAAILSIYVLLGSIGTPLYKHSCFVSEKVNYSFNLQEACCNSLQQNAQTTVSTPDCCEFTSTSFQVDYDSFSLANSLAKYNLFEALGNFLSFSFETPDVINISNYLERRPLLFYGRTLLAFIQSFLI